VKIVAKANRVKVVGTMVRFLKLVEPALQLLPEVAMPERKVRSRH